MTVAKGMERCLYLVAPRLSGFVPMGKLLRVQVDQTVPHTNLSVTPVTGLKLSDLTQ